MKTLPSVTPAAPSFRGAIANIGKGIYNLTARLASYKAAIPTATTTVGSRIGTNSNSTIAQLQRVGMMFTAEDLAKNSAISGAYLAQRANYCSSTITYIPETGDVELDEQIKRYLQGEDGTGGVWANMGMDGSMQGSFMRSADIELPVRGDAGIVWYRNSFGDLRMLEFSADQLGEPYMYAQPRLTALAANAAGKIVEVSGNTLTYFCGRYFSGGDCVAYKVYQRVDSWYGNPTIYAAADVIFFKDPASFRGVRGVTKFANAIQHMEKGERLFQIGMDAAMRQAKTAYAVFNERGAADELSYEDVEYENGRVVHRERINEGPMVEYFYTGDKVQATSADSPGPELIAGCEFSDQRVAIALGLTYSFLISPEKVGGAPSRLDINKVSKEFGRIQNQIHRPALNRIRDVSLLDGLNKGALPPHPNLLRGRFMLPISAVTDAFYEAKENIAMLRSGIESPQELCAETNRSWDIVRRAKKQAAIQVAKDAEDATKELKDAGYKAVVTTNDIMQLTDNPQPAPTEAETAKPPALTEKATLAAYMGDILVGDLPEETRAEIARILGTNGHTSALRAVKYGMVASELERMADPHNLESARGNLRYCTNGSCADEVHSRNEKHILINNGRVVDGHHFLAKALKGKVTKSLHVIDLTPARFQS